jgi:large-conductance mechanosensitive channel
MRIGNFLNTLISFVTIAAAIFVIVKPARLMPKAAGRRGPTEVGC